jgi:signal transduction histidine kinase
LSPEDFVGLTKPLPHPHLLVSGGGALLALNPAAARALGLESLAPGARPLSDLVADSPDRLAAYLRRCAGSGSLLPGSITVPGPAGSATRFRCEGAAFRPAGPDGEPLLLLRLLPHLEASERFLLLNRKIEELAREIHQRRLAEAELQTQAFQLEESTAELEIMISELEQQKEEALRAQARAEEGVRRMAALQEITSDLSAAIRAREVAEVVVERGTRALGARTGTFALLTPGGADLRVLRGSGPGEEGAGARWSRLPLAAPTPLGDAVRTGRPVLLADAREHRERYPAGEAAPSGPESGPLVAVPLVGSGPVRGALCFGFSEGRVLLPEDRELITALAQQGALALDRALLLQRERRSRRAAEVAARRVNVLAEAGVLLSSTLDPEAALETLARLASDTVADYCVTYLRAEDGSIRSVGAAHADPEREPLVRQLQQHYPPDPDAPAGAGAVIRTGIPVLAPEIPDELLAAGARDERHLRILRQLEPSSSIIVPLQARGRVLGAMALATVRGGKPAYAEEDLSLAQELARRAALAVDNALLFFQAQEGSRAKSEFLAVMSHELRTPLNAIIGYSDLLAAEVKGSINDEQREQLARIDRSARHLVAVIQEILEFARLEAGQVSVHAEEVDLAALAREALELVEPSAAARGLAVSLDVGAAPLPARTDAAKLRQILLNLLVNAVKFTERGEVGLSLAAGDDEVRIAVRDTGMGVDAADAERIFEPFWQVQRGTTRQAGGTGLGLTITRRLARLLGGDIRVESEPGRGSTFALELPLRVDAVPDGGLSRPAALTDGRRP